MKTYAFLIIFDFIQIILCENVTNITNDPYPVCPVHRIRAKRAYTDYTRWRANQETTNEFLVKVLDEDLITPLPNPVVAVNIQPITSSNDKIVIGAVNLPSHTTLMSVTSDAREYTRFVPPTTTVTLLDQDVAPIRPATTTEINNVPSIPSQGYLSQRDDSPPASPQFIARTPVLVARQYAPIEAVAFNRRSSVAPITPNLPLFNAYSHPTRTWPPPPLTIPTRAKPDYVSLKNIPVYNDDSVTDYMPRAITNFLERTSQDTKLVLTNTINIDQEFVPTTIKIESGKKQYKVPTDKNSDISYNMLFYNEDDTVGLKKEDIDINEHDYDKNKTEDDPGDTEFPDSKHVGEEIEKDTKHDVDEYITDNITDKGVSRSINGLPSAEIISTSEKFRKQRNLVCDLIKLRQLNFNSPRTLPEIFHQLKMWAENSPVAKWVDITDGNFTSMENPIYMMIVDDPSSGQIVTAKQTVMIVAGIQGRDHHAVAAAMYVLYQLIERSESHSDLLTKYRFWIIPVFNPDGYDYSMTFPHRRDWTKNLHQQWVPCQNREICKSCESHGIRCTIQSCYGVNLDRNFEYQWIPVSTLPNNVSQCQPAECSYYVVADELKAEHPCGNLYAGTRQLSEIETRSLTHFLHEKHTLLFTFLAFKEGDVLGIMYPYSHTRKKRAFDHIYRQRAAAAASAAYRISNRQYVAGQTSEFLPLYAGGIEDWVDGHLGIDNTYTIMMFRPVDSDNSRLITERIVHETYAAMDTLLLQSLEPLGPPSAVLMKTNACAQHKLSKSSIFYIVIVYYILILNG